MSRANSLKRYLPIAMGVVITCVLLWIAVRGASMAEVGSALRHADLWFLLPLLLAYYLQLQIKSLRWAALIAPVTLVRSGQIFPSVMVGAMGSLIFPAYLSEFVRTYILCRELDLKYASVLATIVFERVLDFLTVLAFLGFLLIFAGNLPSQFVTIGYLVGALEIGLILIIGAYIAWPRLFQKVLTFLANPLPSRIRSVLVSQLEIALVGFQSVKQPRLLAIIVILSLLQWLTMGVCTYMAIIAFKISVPFEAAIMVLVLTVVGMTLPSTPGFFGTIQVCFTLGLEPYAVPVDTALASSVFFHLSIYLGTIIPGIFFLRHIGYTFGKLRNEASLVKASDHQALIDTSADPLSHIKRF